MTFQTLDRHPNHHKVEKKVCLFKKIGRNHNRLYKLEQDIDLGQYMLMHIDWHIISVRHALKTKTKVK